MHRSYFYLFGFLFLSIGIATPAQTPDPQSAPQDQAQGPPPGSRHGGAREGHGTIGKITAIHGNSLQHVPDSYRRYLEGWFRKHFSLQGTPLRIEFRSGSNPYAPKRAGKGSAFQVD